MTFETSPDQYKHRRLTVDGNVATLTMDVREDAGLRPNDYKLKLNSYDLGVDIELALGPPGFHDSHQVYLRTAISVDAAGWAHFDYVRLPEYRWGIFLAEPTPDRRIGLGDFKGQPGQFADYIAPPQRGINRQLIDFEYVRTEQ